MCKKVYSTLYFIERAEKIHGDTYDYSNTKYERTASKVVITCKIHGNFEQIPRDHLRGCGCPKCGQIKSRAKTISNKETFIRRAKATHNDVYDYSNVVYINSAVDVVIVCKEHGKFKQRPGNHLKGSGCYKCGLQRISEARASNNKDFISASKLIHNSRYTYEKCEYNRCDKKVIITCPIHGDFLQTPDTHKKGCGCGKCHKDKLKINTFKKSDWVGITKGIYGTLYVLKCYNDNESFIKVGITTKSRMNLRYQKGNMPYDYIVLRTLKSKNKSKIWDIEKGFKSLLGEFKYKCGIPFYGSSTECFNYSEKVVKLINTELDKYDSTGSNRGI